MKFIETGPEFRDKKVAKEYVDRATRVAEFAQRIACQHEHILVYAEKDVKRYSRGTDTFYNMVKLQGVKQTLKIVDHYITMRDQALEQVNLAKELLALATERLENCKSLEERCNEQE